MAWGLFSSNWEMNTSAAVIEPIRGAEFVDQAKIHGGTPVEALRAQEQAARLARADSVDDKWADGGGDETELDLREGKTRVDVCHRDVAAGD